MEKKLYKEIITKVMILKKKEIKIKLTLKEVNPTMMIKKDGIIAIIAQKILVEVAIMEKTNHTQISNHNNIPPLLINIILNKITTDNHKTTIILPKKVNTKTNTRSMIRLKKKSKTIKNQASMIAKNSSNSFLNK
jgi:hypothetical protein